MRLAVATTVALTLGLASCGGGDDDTSPIEGLAEYPPCPEAGDTFTGAMAEVGGCDQGDTIILFNASECNDGALYSWSDSFYAYLGGPVVAQQVFAGECP